MILQMLRCAFAGEERTIETIGNILLLHQSASRGNDEPHGIDRRFVRFGGKKDAPDSFERGVRIQLITP